MNKITFSTKVKYEKDKNDCKAFVTFATVTNQFND